MGGVVIKKAKVIPPTPEVEVVDLGLPSGTKWMKYNIGAKSETEYGLLFQWGATEGHNYDTDAKNYSTWATAPFNNGASSYDATYFNEHKSEWLDDDVLKPQYDAAYQATNGVAHMPTETDFNELKANTTVTWVTNYNSSGVSGRKFTSKTDASKYIFIPASGYALNGYVQHRGARCGVWSSSFYPSGPYYAWNLYFDSGYIDVDTSYRYYCQSVRGVVSKS